MSESLSMKWNRRFRGLTMFVFNFGVGSLQQSVNLLTRNFSISLAILFSKHHFSQTDNQKAVLFTVFSLLELFFSCGGERKPTENAGHCFARKFSNFVATSKARI